MRRTALHKQICRRRRFVILNNCKFREPQAVSKSALVHKLSGNNSFVSVITVPSFAPGQFRHGGSYGEFPMRRTRFCACCRSSARIFECASDGWVFGERHRGAFQGAGRRGCRRREGRDVGRAEPCRQWGGFDDAAGRASTLNLTRRMESVLRPW